MSDSKLPTERRPIRMDPELTEAVEELLEPYDGDELELAQSAVMRVYHSASGGSYAELVGVYRDAIITTLEEATAGV